MEQTHSYRPLCLSLYLNYFVHGIGVIVLAQNMDALAARWGSIADVAWVISMLGIGRLIVLFVSGKLSDKYGRKPLSSWAWLPTLPSSSASCSVRHRLSPASSAFSPGSPTPSSMPGLSSPHRILSGKRQHGYGSLESLHFGRPIPPAPVHRHLSFYARLVRLVLHCRRRYLGPQHPGHDETELSVYESCKRSTGRRQGYGSCFLDS